MTRDKKLYIAKEEAADVQSWQPPAMQGEAINANVVDQMQRQKALVKKKQQERIKQANIKSSPKPQTEAEAQAYSEEVNPEDLEVGETAHQGITAEALEEIRKAAFEEGREQGYQHGLQQAEQEIEQTKTTLAEQIETLASLIEHLQQPIQQFDEDVEHQVIELITLCVHKIVKREIALDPSHLIGVIREAAQYLPLNNPDPVIIELNSKDAEVIKQLLDNDEEHSQWKLFENPTFERGECQIMAGNSTIDVSTEHLLNQVFSKAFGIERQPKPVEEAEESDDE